MASGLEDLMEMIRGLRGGLVGGQPPTRPPLDHPWGQAIAGSGIMPADNMRQQMMEQMLGQKGNPRPGAEFYDQSPRLGSVPRRNTTPSVRNQPKPVKNPGQLPSKYGPPSLKGQPKPKKRVKNLNKPGEGGLPKRKKKKSDKEEIADQAG